MPFPTHSIHRAASYRRQWTRRERAARRAFAPLAVFVAALWFAQNGDSPLGSAFVVCVALSTSYKLCSTIVEHAGFLPLMRFSQLFAAPLGAFVMLSLLKVASVVAGFSVLELASVCALTAILTPISAAGFRPGRTRQTRHQTRVAVIGSPRLADDLAMELAAQPQPDTTIVGYVEPFDLGGAAYDASGPQYLGSLSNLAGIVANNSIDLLLIAGDAPRLSVFEEMGRMCAELPVRAMEVSTFYESKFGHVPINEINAAWFQWAMRPDYVSTISPSKRALDVAIAGTVAVLAAPMLLVLAWLIRRDGGPVFYRQTRIGESGRPFEILKLRSMRVSDPSVTEQWSSADDDRITRVGQFMRKTHIDEMPQVINVLRGEMSIVGPRPEQPGFVERLEHTIPFYSRRHLGRPGVTGWAQVKCGYAGSDLGSAWKLCHDLYYLKHRSTLLDVLILGETARTFFADRQFGDVQQSPFVLPNPVDEPRVASDDRQLSLVG